MSFVTTIRDYVELVNNLNDNFKNGIPSFIFLKETFFYILKTLQISFFYIITFQWFHDFTLLPINIPQLTNSILREKFFLEDSLNPLFSFLELPSLRQNTFILGIGNSIFLTCPISIIHIITIRRLYIKGIPAASYSIAGYLIGQLVFIMAVIFGWRTIINTWFLFEPLNYIIGLILIFKIIYSMTQENLTELDGWIGENISKYRNFFITSFVLAWCEQTSIFQYLGNLNLNPTASLLEVSSNLNTFNSFLIHTFYILGLLIGSIIFTILWGSILLQLKNLLIEFTPIFLSRFIQTVNTSSFIFAISLSLSSIPFYGLDYLLTKPLGFISQDSFFKNTIISQYNVRDSVKGLGISSRFTSLDIDIAPFDRGRYLIYPEKSIPFSFEDLNYRGESEWTNRYDKVSTITDSRASLLTLSKILKKNKSTESNVNSQHFGEDKNILPIKSKPLSSPTTYKTSLDSRESRFEDWYTLDPDISADGERPIESVFAEIQDTSFPLDFTRTRSLEFKNIDLKIKQKYYSNPIYKNLLALDIDLFLNRQSSKFKLNSDNEVDLYTRRRILNYYYDSLRQYMQLPYKNNFINFFDGTKSFTNKVYNQQFKGTLRSVCRLFSLTTDSERNSFSSETVLKYDQPLYTFGNQEKFKTFHEELDIPNASSPYLNDMVSGPVYAGWDEKLRKFIVTNKFLPRTLAGYKVNLSKEIQTKFQKSKLSPLLDSNYKIKFTAWPLSKNIINKGKKESLIPFTTLYIPRANFEISGDPTLENLASLPSNWETRNRKSDIGIGKIYENIFDYLAPNRGGFIWPGNQKVNFTLNK